MKGRGLPVFGSIARDIEASKLLLTFKIMIGFHWLVNRSEGGQQGIPGTPVGPSKLIISSDSEMNAFFISWKILAFLYTWLHIKRTSFHVVRSNQWSKASLSHISG